MISKCLRVSPPLCWFYLWPLCLASSLFTLDFIQYFQAINNFICSAPSSPSGHAQISCLTILCGMVQKRLWSTDIHCLCVGGCVCVCVQVSVRHLDALCGRTANFSRPCTSWVHFQAPPHPRFPPLMSAVSPDHREINIKWLAAMFSLNTPVMAPQGLCQS